MMRLLSPLVFALGFLAGAVSAAEPSVKREDTEWTYIWLPHLTRTDLPRVLLVGDSICNSYYDAVAGELQGKALVAKLATSSSLGDPALLDQVKFLVTNYKFAAIHFNNGLHGYGYSDAEYAGDIPKLLKIIRQHSPGTKLIWATTTPQRKPAPKVSELHEENRIVLARNKIVVRVAAREAIPVDDLYSLVENHPEYWGGDGVHFNPEGQAVLAKQVAKTILDALAK
jgi:hypothetical protein